MNCGEQMKLFQQEYNAKAAVRKQRKSDPDNHQKLAGLQDLADDVTIKLRAHVALCLRCNKPVGDYNRFNQAT
jgi:hypothetical protein